MDGQDEQDEHQKRDKGARKPTSETTKNAKKNEKFVAEFNRHKTQDHNVAGQPGNATVFIIMDAPKGHDN